MGLKIKKSGVNLFVLDFLVRFKSYFLKRN